MKEATLFATKIGLFVVFNNGFLQLLPSNFPATG